MVKNLKGKRAEELVLMLLKKGYRLTPKLKLIPPKDKGCQPPEVDAPHDNQRIFDQCPLPRNLTGFSECTLR